jgi:electron transfer flavoprotein alpha subunit
VRILVVGEHDGRGVCVASRSALAFARQCAAATSGSVEWLLLGHQLDKPAADAAAYAPVLAADSPALADPLAERYAPMIAAAVTEHRADLLAAASGTFAKDIVTRAAGLLGGAMAGDVVGHEFHEGRLRLQRPMYAGAVLATVELCGTPQIVTVQPAAYAPAERSETVAEIAPLTFAETDLPGQSEYLGLASQRAGRPDVSEARVVVSGGRGIRSREDFERLVGGLADAFGGAAGSTRPLVDAGIAPNEFQVGQTGKIIAPDLYVALGVSGSVQHLAGVKNSKLIVAVNRDPEAPIFSAADYGLVADIYEAVPELIAKLCSV